MRLLADDVIERLEKKMMGYSFCMNLSRMIQDAEKFIFDSGSDQDPDTIAAVNDTAAAMMSAGLFRLPHPLVYVEDPFRDVQDTRLFYVCEEIGNEIHAYFILGNPAHRSDFLVHATPVILNMTTDTIRWDPLLEPEYVKKNGRSDLHHQEISRHPEHHES